MSEQVWVRATMSFDDVERGDVFSLDVDRAIALGHFVEPVDMQTLDPSQEGAALAMELGEPEVDFEEDPDEGGRLPAED